ncbi:MAG: FadR family transcriptional regulator [Chloroflexi bacterium]|nr:FadR family transcriptional regulator [Chloroflexota bacterium]
MRYSHQKSSVAEETVEHISEMIRTGEYAPGDQLPSERKLAQELHVGRTSIREAIRQLETVGLLESRQGLGTFVKDPSGEVIRATLFPHFITSQETIRKLFEVREIIEVEAAGRAAERAETTQITLMRKWVQAVETHIAREDGQSMINADVEFHRQIVIATDNDILVSLMDSIVGLLHEMRTDSMHIPDLLPGIVSGHRAILAAIEMGDSQAARQAMKDHLTHVGAAVQAYWVQDDPEIEQR